MRADMAPYQRQNAELNQRLHDARAKEAGLISGADVDIQKLPFAPTAS